MAGTKRMVEFVSYDDQSDPGQAAKIYEKLISQDKVDLLLGPWGTPHHFAVAGVLERYKFPMVGDTAASVQLRDLKPGYIWFPTSALPDEQGKQLPLLLKSLGVKTVAITTAQHPFALENKKFIVEGLKANGIEVVSNVEYPLDIRDMTALISSLKQANPDAELSLSMTGDSVLYTRQAKELGFTPRVQFVLVGPAATFFTKIFGDQVDGLLTMGHWSPSQTKWPKAKPFYDAYVAKYGEPPDYLELGALVRGVRDHRTGGGEGRSRSREAPPDHRQRYLRHHRRPGEVQRRGQCHDADDVSSIPQRRLRDRLAEIRGDC